MCTSTPVHLVAHIPHGRTHANLKVSVDTEGDVVWYANFSSPFGTEDDGNFPSHAIDQVTLRNGAGAKLKPPIPLSSLIPLHRQINNNQLPNYNLVFQSMIKEAPLMEFTPYGEMVQYITDDAECGVITHEARYDSYSPSDAGDVISTKEVIKAVDGLHYPQTGNEIIRWNREAGTYDVMASTFEMFDVLTDRGYLSDLEGVNNPYSDDCNGMQRGPRTPTLAYKSSSERNASKPRTAPQRIARFIMLQNATLRHGHVPD